MKKFLFLLFSLYAFFSINELLAQDAIQVQKISGVVINQANGNPVVGASISVPGFASAMSNDSGNFVVNIPDNYATLIVNCPGYSSREIGVKSRLYVRIFLYDDNYKTSMDGIEMPFGSVIKSQSAASVSSIKENNILSNSSTPENLLQSNTTGLSTIFRSGMPGSGANINLHGYNSLNAGTTPLFVVDGMVFETNSIGQSLIENYYANPLSGIDVKDIESITVLKDGSSLYGVKGGNGVILINTIHAKGFDTRINFHYHTGINNTPNYIPLLNATQHKVLLTELNQDFGYTPDQIQQLPYINNQVPYLEKWGYEGNTDYYRYNNNTDWQKEVFNKSYNSDYYLNVTGGDEVSKLGLSLGYMDHQGVLKNTDFQRFNVRFNAEVKLSEKLKIMGNMSFVYMNRVLRDEGPFLNTNPILSSLVKAPFMTSHIISANGKVSPNLEDYDIFNLSNPYAFTSDNVVTNNLNYRFLGNYMAVWDITKNLSANFMLGLNFNKDRERLFYPTVGIYFPTITMGTVDNKLGHRVERLLSLYNEGRLNWKKVYSNGISVSAQAGIRYQSNKAEDDGGISYNSSSDNFKSIQYGDPKLRSIVGSVGNWNWMSLYSAIDLDFKNRYFLSCNIAADASSRYGRDVSKFLTYPSVSAAWLLSSESFMHGLADYLDMLKVRVSYGISGNDNIGNYEGMTYYVSSNFIGTYGLLRGNLVNTKLKPEKVIRRNVGLDLTVLNERLTVSVDYYKNTTEDMITISSVTPVTGFKSYISNAGSMENKGFDVSVYGRVINTKVIWDAGLNVSTYRNKVTELNGDNFYTEVAGATIMTKVGQPIGLFYGYKTNGVYATQTDANKDELNVLTGTVPVSFSAGDVIFENNDQTPYIDNNSVEYQVIDDRDRQVIGDPNPDFTGSFNNTFKYKNFSLDINFTFSYGNDIYNYTRATLESMSGEENQTEAVLNRWKYEGQITSMPRASFGDPMGNSRFSDRWIEDGSYLRFKKVQLTYNVPVKQKILQNCQVYTSVENLLTITGYKGYDPEFALGQSPLYNGIDACFAPQTLSFFVGIKLGL